MNLKFWKRDKHGERREEPSSPATSGALGGGFGAATGHSGSIGNMGGGGSDTPLHGSTGTRSSTGRIGDSSSGRH